MPKRNGREIDSGHIYVYLPLSQCKFQKYHTPPPPLQKYLKYIAVFRGLSFKKKCMSRLKMIVPMIMQSRSHTRLVCVGLHYYLLARVCKSISILTWNSFTSGKHDMFFLCHCSLSIVVIIHVARDCAWCCFIIIMIFSLSLFGLWVVVHFFYSRLFSIVIAIYNQQYHSALYLLLPDFLTAYFSSLWNTDTRERVRHRMKHKKQINKMNAKMC